MSAAKEKRLTVDMDKITHNHIKKISVDLDISMREWVLGAILDKIEKDRDLGFIFESSNKVLTKQ